MNSVKFGLIPFPSLVSRIGARERILNLITVLAIGFVWVLAIIAKSPVSISKIKRNGFAASKSTGVEAQKLREQLKIWKISPSGTFHIDTYVSALFEAESRFGVDHEILFALAAVESAFQLKAESHKGARGLYQFMPDTAELIWPRLKRQLKSDDALQLMSASVAAHDIRASTLMSAFYLSELQKLFEGRIHLALASYNVGPGALKKGLDEGKLLSSEYVFRVFDLANEYRGRT